MKWDGYLLLGHGWAHYRGMAGDTTYHSHYATQMIFADKTDVQVQLGDLLMTGRTICVSSGLSHKLQATTAVIDLLFVEPTLMTDDICKAKSVEECFEIPLDCTVPVQDVRMGRAIKAVEDKLTNKVKQAAIIEAAGMSKSSFTHHFRKTFGMPLRRYVLWRRLNLAVKAIGAGRDATTAAHEAGFADSAHFSRTMRQTFGVSPTEGVLRIKINSVN
jgi:AraC-like DNA-binding protein